MSCLCCISKNHHVSASTPLIQEVGRFQKIKKVVTRCLCPKMFSNASLRNVVGIVVSEFILGGVGYKIGSEVPSENPTTYCLMGSSWFELPSEPCSFEVTGNAVAGTFIGMGIAACLGAVHYFCCLPSVDYEENAVNVPSSSFSKEVAL